MSCPKFLINIIFTIILIVDNQVVTGGVIAALLKAPRMKRRQAARVTENCATYLFGR